MNNQQSSGGSRAAVWAIIGVLIGAALPVFLCLGLGFFAVLGAGVIFSRATTAVPEDAEYVSGPMTGPAVALIDVRGDIEIGQPSSSSESVAASRAIVPLVRMAAANPDVMAIVLRVDSPGGSVVASNEIYHALTEVDVPIVAVMGSMAASGGYYISMAAEHIVANPDTLTCSIGVIAQFQNATELLKKIGVDVNTIKSGQFKDIGNPAREMTDEERQLLQTWIDEAYDSFVQIVAGSRGLSEQRVRELADGRICSGRQALSLGLIDALGYESDGIAKAAELGGIEGEPRVIHYRQLPGLDTLFGSLARAALQQALQPLGVRVDQLSNGSLPILEYR